MPKLNPTDHKIVVALQSLPYGKATKGEIYRKITESQKMNYRTFCCRLSEVCGKEVVKSDGKGEFTLKQGDLRMDGLGKYEYILME